MPFLRELVTMVVVWLGSQHHNSWNYKLWRNLDKVALLVADPPPANSTPDTHTHHLGYGDHMVGLIFGCKHNWRSFITRQTLAISGAPLYIAVTFEPIMRF